MFYDATMKSAFNSLDFNFKTSSGDKLSLSMYDEKKMSTGSYQDGTQSIQAFSLSHAYGYSFSYVGDGISEQDQKEIDEAMKLLQPKIDDFMQKVQNEEILLPKDITNSAFDMKTLLPEVKDLNHLNKIQDELLKLFDNRLSEFKPSEILLNNTKKLFDKLLEQMQSFSLYV